ncbi:hypothetical protein KC19_8G200000 [Ceratodon purpureus]|uniref:DUF8039 domain-containing protein n=1 Tax=Ceratodon purpureus TaxID=3225 RepID=A0A8T0H2Z5_CERPU|nr:hypothetical protein KC19_8G200000 [Ceratodon purpureus]
MDRIYLSLGLGVRAHDSEDDDNEQERSESENNGSSDFALSVVYCFAADDDGEKTSSGELQPRRGSLHRKSESGPRAQNRNTQTREAEQRTTKKRVTDEEGRNRGPQNTMHGHFIPSMSAPGTSKTIPVQESYTWVQVPSGASPAITHTAPSAVPNHSISGQWQFIPSQIQTNPPSLHIVGASTAAELSGSKSSTVNEESVKRKIRRQRKRKEDEDAKKRVEQGLKPYVVQVKPSGLIDSGCKGHLQWQELVRNLTPRLLDLSVPVYEEQNPQSQFLLWEALKQKFEFVDNEVTQSSCDKMIKTWLRKDRERIKRTHGSSVKPPPGYTDEEWESMKKYWNSDSTKQKSERMSDTRKKVINNSRLGRDGYAGKAAKVLRSESEKTPGWTDVAEDIKVTHETQLQMSDMHRRNSTRLSAMERNQAETNRRLDDIKSILQSVISNMNSFPKAGSEHGIRVGTPPVEETDGLKEDGNFGYVDVYPAEGSSEQRWDEVQKTGDDNVVLKKVKRRTVVNTDVGVTKVSEVAKRTEDNELETGSNQTITTELRVGDWVWLAEKADSKTLVATGQVSAIADGGMFHNRPIPIQYVRVNVESVAINVPLYVPVEDADQNTMTDALGSSVLWPKRLTFRTK